MPGAEPTPVAQDVVVIATNAETRQSLREYFGNLGLSVRATSTLRLDELPATPGAIVLFPDDFADKLVFAFLRKARAKWPELVMVAVTRDLPRFQQVLASDGRSLKLVVLPRPSFGWAILDAIRWHETSSPPESTR